jgi:hypothetical protein
MSKLQITIDNPQYAPTQLFSNSISFDYFHNFSINSSYPSNVPSTDSNGVIILFADNLTDTGDNYSCFFGGDTRSTMKADRPKYYVEVNIENRFATDISDAVVPIKFSTIKIINEGKMRKDCTDLYLRDSSFHDINSEKYWTDFSSCNSLSTTIWLKLASLQAGERKKYHLVYGSIYDEKSSLDLNKLEFSALDIFKIFIDL